MKQYILVLFLFLFFQKNLSAQLYFKNEAPFTVWVAIGYYVPATDEWYAKGWYKLDDNAKKKLFDYDLSYNRYYYYYAYDSDGNYWVGGKNCETCGSFLIDPTAKFTKSKSGSKKGYKWKKFKRIDTGSSSSHTVTLSGKNWSTGDCENGYGTYKWISQSKKYKGYWRNGKRDGEGTCEYGKFHSVYSGCKFEGEWRNNTWYSGTFSCDNGYKAVGKWKNDKLNGKAIITYSNGSTYEGELINGELHGYGYYYWTKQDKTYKGQWINGKREGKGSSTYGTRHTSLANCTFDGYWENNTWKSGTLIYADGSKYVGAFSSIKKHGKGKLYDRNGTLIKSGEWINDELVFTDEAKPVVTWDAPSNSNMTVSKSSFRIKACVLSRGNLGNVKIIINGKETVSRGFSVEDDCTQYVNSIIALDEGRNNIYISATNTMGTTKSEKRTIYYNRTNPSPSNSVTYYALLIGVDDYTDLGITDLDNPIKDTRKLKRVLTSKYDFQSRNIYHLKNPTRREIITELEALEKKLSVNDYLLVFFSGHGKMQGEEGYWLPSDAQPGTCYQWLSSSDVNVHIKRFKSKHVLLIADACYSGAFVMRDVDDVLTNYRSRSCEIQEGKQSRCAMTSGAKNTVPDNSVFIKYLVKELEENPYSCISAEQIYMEIKDPVISNSPNSQIPQFGDIPRTGHEGGNFIFKKK